MGFNPAIKLLDPPLQPAELAQLREAQRRMKLPEGIRRSARILIGMHETGSARAVAKYQHASTHTIAKVLKRYRSVGVSGILSAPAPQGRPTTEEVKRLKVCELGKDPRLTIKAIAAAAGVSVGFAATQLKPRPHPRRKKPAESDDTAAREAIPMVEPSR